MGGAKAKVPAGEAKAEVRVVEAKAKVPVGRGKGKGRAGGVATGRCFTRVLRFFGIARGVHGCEVGDGVRGRRVRKATPPSGSTVAFQFRSSKHATPFAHLALGLLGSARGPGSDDFLPPPSRLGPERST